MNSQSDDVMEEDTPFIITRNTNIRGNVQKPIWGKLWDISRGHKRTSKQMKRQHVLGK